MAKIDSSVPFSERSQIDVQARWDAMKDDASRQRGI